MRYKKSFFIVFLFIYLFGSFFLIADSSVSGASQVNKCEVNTYTITIENSSVDPITDIVVHNFMPTPGFSYVPGSSTISGPGCNANDDPAINGNELIWDIDNVCGSGITLNPGETLTISFDMETDCDAVSGSNNVHLDYNIGGSPSSDDTSISIEVLPGAIKITKTPSVISASVGDNVTWTIKVENTGIGKVKNVEITDVLDSGLLLLSTNPTGNVNGQTVTWDSSNIAQLSEMDPGDIVEITYQAQVIACENLENKADVKWGCSGGTCFDSSVDGGTATASVQLIVKSPSLDYNPPDINFNYCDDTTTVSFPITNNGDGIARDVKLCVDFGPLSVINVTSPATYTNGCFEIPDLNAGDSFNLEFSLSYSNWCSRPLPSGTLLWQPNYKDECDNEYYPPVKSSSYNSPSSTAELSVSKTGPVEIQIGSQVNYHINVDYSGQTSCGSGTTGNVNVTDNVPNGFTVVDSGGGTWNPGTDGTGGTIIWSFDPSSNPHFETDITLQAPGTDQCEDFCFTTFNNSVEASVTDCCGCALTASDSQTTAIECEQLVDSNKTVSPSTVQKCEEFTYNNQYDFTNSSVLDNVDLSQLQFDEHADNNQQYVSGSLNVVFDGTDITSCVGITDNTPGGYLLLDFSGCTGYGSVKNKNLTITYNLRVTDQSQPSPPCEGSYTFYSWSTLDLGITGGECIQDSEIHETTEATIEPPAMSVTISGIPALVEKCGSYNFDLIIDRTSVTGVPYDVMVRLNTDNYYILSVNGYDGVTPVSGPIDHGTYYEWNYGDNFSSANQGIIHLTVEKKCEGSSGLTASVQYDDNCHNDTQPDQMCSASTTYSPPLMTGGDLIIKKTPEVYYANTNTAQWKIYVINKGNGTAYNVWIDDILGAGLTYGSATVNDMTGVTINPNQDHNGGSINGVGILIDNMAPAERREITITANLIDCDNLTNDVTASQGCLGSDCQTPVTDNSIVKIPDPILVATNNIPTPINSCSEETATITIKNAGTTTVYNLEITETLPTGLHYVSGTTEWQKNGGGWNAGSDPNPSTSPLKWTKNELSALSDLSPGDTLEIRFHVVSDCDFQGGDVVFQLQYENPCGEVLSLTPSTFHIALNEPDISITKTRTTPTAGEPLSCGQNVTWQIEVTNNSGYTLPVVWVEDVLGGAFTYVSSTGDSTYGPADGGYNSGQNVYWEIKDLPSGATATLTITAQTDSAPCSHDLDNTVTAYWGCGIVDGDSSTNPNSESGACLSNTGITDTNTSTREPDLNMGISVSPTSIDSCSGSSTFTVDISNNGDTNAGAVDLVITLPPGLTYQPGSSNITCPGGGGGTADPVISGNQLIYYDINDKANNLCDSIPGQQTAQLVFAVSSDCFLTSNMGFTLYYYDCCNDTQYNINTNQQITALYPQLSVTKDPSTVALDCSDPSDTVTWTVTVTNNGTGNADWVRIEDTLGDSLIHDSGGTQLGGDPQRWGWEIGPLNAGASQNFQLTAHIVQPPDCNSSHKTNTVEATWGCGSFDGNPNTTGEYSCESGITSSDTAEVQLPEINIGSDSTGEFTCTSDGNNSARIMVRVRNDGDAPVSSDFKISVSDDHGWSTTGYFSADFGGTLPIAAHSVRTIYVEPWSLDCMTCDSIITIEADPDNEVCECNENNNTRTINYHTPSHNLKVNSITPSCSSDGNTLAQVVIENDGCNDASNFVVHLEDNLGHSRDITVSSLAAGATTTVNFTNWPTACSPTSVTFTATVDFNDNICECDGSDNTINYDYTNTSPDLIINSVSPSTTCNSDGNVSGEIQVSVSNQGNEAITNDFRVNVSDGQGWSSELWYNADLGGTLPLQSGASETVSFNWTRNFTTSPYTCDFNITATVDSQQDVCECTDGNNTASTSYHLPYPDLNIQSMSASCASDGNLQLQLTVSNSGCEDVTTDFNIEISDNKGHNNTYTFTSLGGTLPLQAGVQQTLTFSQWPYDCSSQNIDFTVVLDSDSNICELSSSGNTFNWTYTLNEPDIHIGDITYGCNPDASLDFTVPVLNTGYGDATGVILNVYDEHNSLIHTQTIDISQGSSVDVSFTSPSYSDCASHNFRFTVDEGENICECNGDNNEKEITTVCGGGLITEKTVSKESLNACEEVEFTLRVENVGYLNAYNLKIIDQLPPGFTYVNNSTYALLPGGTYTNDPVVSGQTLVWDIGSQLNGGVPKGEELELKYRARAASCVYGKNSFTNSFKVEATDGSGTVFNTQGCDPDDIDPDDSSSVSTRVICPALAIERICPEENIITLKDNIEYILNITNNGDIGSQLNEIEITDEIPEGWSLVNYKSIGGSPQQGPSGGDTGILIWKYGDFKLEQGETLQLKVTLKPSAESCGKQFKDILKVTAKDDCGQAVYNSEASQCNVKVACGVPIIKLRKRCPRAQLPGGIYNFELEISNTGDGKAEDVLVEDILPDNFQYVKDSSLLDSSKIYDPEISGQRLVWKIGELDKGESHILRYKAIAPSDTDPGRYCNKALVKGVSPDGTEISSNPESCCTILRREVGGCCLYIEEKPFGITHIPDGYFSIVDPYFQTEDALFISYASLKLWHSGKYPDKRMAERLKNYSLFNLKELFFKSDFGLTLPDNTLWMPYAGAYISKSGKRWKVDKTDMKITPSQVAFQLLALQESIPEFKDSAEREKIKKIINKQLNWIKGIKEFLPSYWKFKDGKLFSSEEKASRTQKAIFYYALIKMSKAGYKEVDPIIPKILKNLKIKKFKEKEIRGELFLTLSLIESENIKLARKKSEKILQKVKQGKLKLKTVEELALAYFTASKTQEPYAKEFYNKIIKHYLNNIGIISPQTSEFNYKINLRDTAALIMATELGNQSTLFKSVYKSIDEAGLFFRKRFSWRLEYPAVTVFNYLKFPKQSPIFAIMGRPEDVPNVFFKDSVISLPENIKSLKMTLPSEILDVVSDSYENSISRISLDSIALAYLGKKFIKRKDVYSETGREFIYLAKNYIKSLKSVAPGFIEKGELLVPKNEIAVKGKIDSFYKLEPLKEGYSYTIETLANYLLAKNVLGEKISDKFYSLMLAGFKEIGYIPKRIDILINKNGEYKITPSKERAKKITVAKLYKVFGDEMLLKLLSNGQEKLNPEDLIILVYNPDIVTYFKRELEEIIVSNKRTLKWVSARILAAELLGRDSTNYLNDLKYFYKEKLGIPVGRYERVTGGVIYRIDLEEIALYIEAQKNKKYYERTVDFIDHLLQSGWELNYTNDKSTGILSLPPKKIMVIKGLKREVAQPGDLLTFRVTTRNICPVGYSRAKDLPQLLIEAKFNPELIYFGSENKEQLSVIKDFLWKYQYLNEGEILDYSYQALIPNNFEGKAINGELRAIGYTGYTPFFPENSSGERCDAYWQVKGMKFRPYGEIKVRVFLDRNANGEFDIGETGVMGIILRDSEGKIYSTDSEGVVTVYTGLKPKTLQLSILDMKSDLYPTTKISRVITGENREILFGLTQRARVKGIVYVDSNGNGRYDKGEKRVSNVLIKAEYKRKLSGKDGVFEFKLMPVAWIDKIGFDKEQPFYKGMVKNLKIKIWREN